MKLRQTDSSACQPQADVMEPTNADGDEEEDEEKRSVANVRERRRMCGINVAFLVGFLLAIFTGLKSIKAKFNEIIFMFIKIDFI